MSSLLPIASLPFIPVSGPQEVIIIASCADLLPTKPFLGPLKGGTSVPPPCPQFCSCPEMTLTSTTVNAVLAGVSLPWMPAPQDLGKTLDIKVSLVFCLGPQRWHHLCPSASVSLLSGSVPTFQTCPTSHSYDSRYIKAKFLPEILFSIVSHRGTGTYFATCPYMHAPDPVLETPRMA